jgi:hypothetical protein
MAKRAEHDHTTEKLAIDDLLSRFPVTGRDRSWSARPIVRRGFGAAHRVFDKHFKDKLAAEQK